ncbi:MAG: flagellar protein FlgN [Zoogloeaceae bacterium]|jgi:flagellar biosynthesis/type III secretory pathway chaperone|nr:flagellar protein FlgN [Zoogloeaceae bacterium]
MSVPDFAQALASEIVAVRKFIALLQEEQLQLREKQMEALERTCAVKASLAVELEKISATRNACLADMGLNIETSGKTLEAWIGKQNNPRLLQAWHTLQSLARDAKSLNEQNGQCIALLARNNREQFDALTGRQANGMFYSPDGQAASSSASRISDSV